MNIDLISADRARCSGTGSSSCDTCARRMQIALDEHSAGCYPHIAAMATNGQCIFKIEDEEMEAVK